MDVLLVLCLAVVATCILLLLRPRHPRCIDAKAVRGPTEHDQRASDRLVDLIDILFALVLSLPVLVAEEVISAPWESNVPIILAFTIAYYVVIRSFVDWHLAMEDAPYWIRTSARKTWELRRVYVDFVIVMVYAMLFLSTKGLADDAGADTGRFLFILAVILALYLLWGALRGMAYKSQHEYRWQTLAQALVGYIALWAAYRTDRDYAMWLADHGAVRNVIALSLALGLLLAYRLANWNEMRHVRVLAPATEPAETGTAPATAPPSAQP